MVERRHRRGEVARISSRTRPQRGRSAPRLSRTCTGALGTADFKNNYTYDARSRMTKITQQGNGGATVAPKQVDFDYNALDQFKQVKRYSDLGTTEVATSTFGYDSLARLNSLTHKQGTTQKAAYTWTYDALNRVTQAVSSGVGGANPWNGDGTVNYAYDATDQLVGADYTSQADESYVHDLNGNRSDHGFTRDADNQILQDDLFLYDYDFEGNRKTRTRRTGATSQVDYITEYEWDHRQRLTKVTFKRADTNPATVTSTVSYVYDAFDRRVKRSVDTDGNGSSNRDEWFVYDGDDVILDIVDADGAGAANSPLKNAFLAFFNLAKCGAKLRTARGITTYVAIP